MTGKPDLLKILVFYQADVQEHRVSQLIRCVVHQEDRASMSLNLTKGLLNCMACGFSGDVYSLVMRKEGIGFGAARERAAEIAGEPAPVRPGAGRPGLHGGSRAGRGGFKPRVKRSPLRPEA